LIPKADIPGNTVSLWLWSGCRCNSFGLASLQYRLLFIHTTSELHLALSSDGLYVHCSQNALPKQNHGLGLQRVAARKLLLFSGVDAFLILPPGFLCVAEAVVRNFDTLFFYFVLLAGDCCFWVLTRYTAHEESICLLTRLWFGEPRNRGSNRCMNKRFSSSQSPG
jgi:hypothetical protein